MAIEALWVVRLFDGGGATLVPAAPDQVIAEDVDEDGDTTGWFSVWHTDPDTKKETLVRRINADFVIQADYSQGSE